MSVEMKYTNADYIKLNKLSTKEWQELLTSFTVEEWVSLSVQFWMVFVTSTGNQKAKSISRRIYDSLSNNIEPCEILSISVVEAAEPLQRYCSEQTEIPANERFNFASGIRTLIANKGVTRTSFSLIKHNDRAHDSTESFSYSYMPFTKEQGEATYDWEDKISPDAVLFCSLNNDNQVDDDIVQYCCDDYYKDRELICEDSHRRTITNDMLETIRGDLSTKEYQTFRSLVLDHKNTREISLIRGCTHRTINNYRKQIREKLSLILSEGGIDVDQLLAN